jgi:hypothetical protein
MTRITNDEVPNDEGMTNDVVFTPKEFRHIAQGCSRSELPWVEKKNDECTPQGFCHRNFANDTTPFRVKQARSPHPRVARYRGQPWAK